MEHTGKILIVDDEVEALENCRRILTRLGHDCLTEADPVRAVERIESERPELVLTDLRMPRLDGLGVLAQAKRIDPSIKVVLLTAYSSVQTAVASMRDGAMDYILKPYSSKDLEDVARRAFGSDDGWTPSGDAPVQRALAADAHHAALEPTVRGGDDLHEAGADTFALRQIVGRSFVMQSVLNLIRKVSGTDASILIYGESGTGKELVARAIHAASPRAHQPFVTVDCAALSDTLLESELFGHERGAFTGAHTTKAGLFEVAQGGTVFLDEVSGMSHMLQARLLRVLQERHVRRVGGTRYSNIDVRVIAASNADLEEACRKGTFREDLYYRLNVIPIVLPPLRERDGDVEYLARVFLARFMAKGLRAGVRTTPPDFAPEALAALTRYSWPGNVRELQNVIERAAALSDGPIIRLEHLPAHVQGVAREPVNEPDVTPYKEAKQEVVRSFERSYLMELLKRHEWHMGNAAQEAGVDRKTIERMVKRHGLREN
ncbi:MAG: sigma-54 dependent transcriptional regulator [Nitrospiraceae bacterium]